MAPDEGGSDGLLDVEDMDDPSYYDLLWEVACSFPQVLGMSLALGGALLSLSVYSYVHLDPGDPGYVIVRIDIALLSVFLVVVAYTFTRCLR